MRKQSVYETPRETLRRGYRTGQRNTIGLALHIVQKCPNIQQARREIRVLLDEPGVPNK